MALDCRDVARVDLRMDAKGDIYVIEVNPLPGLTPGYSDLCLIAKAAGIDYRTLIGEILAGGLKRLREKRASADARQERRGAGARPRRPERPDDRQRRSPKLAAGVGERPPRPAVPNGERRRTRRTRGDWSPSPPTPGGMRKRLRDLGFAIGHVPTGPLNAITDVPGVRVGHTTLIQGDGPLIVGEGPVRTGVTAVLPHNDIFSNRVIAGAFVLNGAGEVSGLTQVSEWGLLETPILLTNTMAVGKVSDAAVKWMTRQFPGIGTEYDVIIPLVGECDDSWLNDAVGRHVRSEHVYRAIEQAAGGPVAEGSVGRGHRAHHLRLQGRHRHQLAPGRHRRREPVDVQPGRPGAVELRRACDRCASTACPWARRSTRGSRERTGGRATPGRSSWS